MSENKIGNLILGAIATIEATATPYNSMIDDVNLPQAFHEVGQSLGFTKQILGTATDRLKERHLTSNYDNVVCSLEDGNKKAKLLEDMFKQVAAPTESSRLDCYLAILQRHGNDSAVEVLMLGLLKDISVLADSEIIDATQSKELCDMMDKLLKVEPSVHHKGHGGKFYHFGSGPQINNTDRGTQNNNTGNGNQYHAGVMHFGGK